MNIFSKKALKDTGMHHLRLLCTLGRISCLMFLPIWLIFDFGNVTNHLSDENNVSSSIIFLLVIDGITHWLQNILAFTILKLVAPLTYAVVCVLRCLLFIQGDLIKIIVLFLNLTLSRLLNQALPSIYILMTFQCASQIRKFVPQRYYP